MKGITMALRSRRTALAATTALTLVLAACGGGEEVGEEEISARPAQEQITVTSTDAATPFTLQAGRYKVGWDATECSGVHFVMTGQTQGFTWEKKTLQKKFSSIVSDVPEDTYTLAQTDAACTMWSVQIDRLGS